MRLNPLATWELRVGIKLRRRVRFGKEVIDL